jgi:hypothetical protein
MLRKNLGCFGVVFLGVLMFSPFVTKIVLHGSCCLACCEGYFSLTQSSCPGMYSRLMKKERGRTSVPELHWRVHA